MSQDIGDNPEPDRSKRTSWLVAVAQLNDSPSRSPDIPNSVLASDAAPNPMVAE
jgi:hypothetical protein